MTLRDLFNWLVDTPILMLVVYFVGALFAFWVILLIGFVIKGMWSDAKTD